MSENMLLCLVKLVLDGVKKAELDQEIQSLGLEKILELYHLVFWGSWNEKHSSCF